MTTKPTVFLVDDDESVRDAVQWLLEADGQLVETFSSADQFLESFNPTLPGCLVLDVRMPGMSGLELQKHLRVEKCGLPIILITGHGDVPMCARAFESGAFGFLEKPINHRQLLQYVQRAIQTDQQNRRAVAPSADFASRIQLLTRRENEVMEMLAAGKSMKQIALELNISIPTCSKHRSKVLQKLRVENDVELVRLILAANKPVVP